MHRSILLSLLLVPLVGCTAARATYYIYDAQRKLNDAVAAGAPDRAPYEYTLADAFLEKAKEEDGYSDFGAAEKLSRKSMEYAAAAFQKSNDEGADLRKEVEKADEFVPENKPEEEKKPDEPDNLDIDLDDL